MTRVATAPAAAGKDQSADKEVMVVVVMAMTDELRKPRMTVKYSSVTGGVVMSRERWLKRAI